MHIFWGVVARTGQAAVEASVTLLVGLLVAAVMRRMLGADGTRRLFGGGGWRGLLRAWGIGTLLPVCSLGVIPIARELRRAGVPSGTVLAFVLAAPHINPLSLLYGLTLSEPLVIVCFAGASLTLALTAGAVWDLVFAKPEDLVPQGDEPTPAPGAGRLVAVFVAAARDAVSSSMLFVLVGLIATGLLAAFVPFGSLGATMRHDNARSPLVMAGLAIPAYCGPLQGMMKLGLMFEHGNSVGAAFVLFELGIGVNVGLAAWLGAVFGWRRVLLWLALVVAATVGLGYAAERPLYFAHEEASHTHAFDDWSNPFSPGGGELAAAGAKVRDKVEVMEPIALLGLGLFVLCGGALAWADPNRRLDSWLCRPAKERPRSRWDVVVPGPILGLVALAGLVVFSLVALFLYYPAPADVFAEIGRVRAEAMTAVRSGNKEEGIRQLESWDLLTRKLQVGVLLRTGRLDPEAAKLADEVRERIEEVRDALLAGDVKDAIAKLPAVESAHRQCRAAFLPSPVVE